MKELIFINGTMGVGKTTTSRELQKLLPNCVFLDGDWCWDMSPFTVTAETKKMVIDNICHLLNNFLSCSAYEHILFCWVMQEEQIITEILSRLKVGNYRLTKFSLICSEMKLKERLMRDVEAGVRSADVLERSTSRLQQYLDMDTEKIDVGVLTPESAARKIYNGIMKKRAEEER